MRAISTSFNVTRYFSHQFSTAATPFPIQRGPIPKPDSLLEKEHAEDVFLELAGVHLAAQDVGGFEEVAFKLGQGERHGLAGRV